MISIPELKTRHILQSVSPKSNLIYAQDGSIDKTPAFPSPFVFVSFSNISECVDLILITMMMIVNIILVIKVILY